MENLKPKEPLLAVLLHFFFPGLGQIYAGRVQRGFFFVLISAIFIGASLVYSLNFPKLLHEMFAPTTKLHLLLGPPLLAILSLVAFNVFVAIDAYRCAKKWNFRNNLKREITNGKRVALIAGSLLILIVHPVDRVLNLIVPRHFEEDLEQSAEILKRTNKAFKMSSSSMEPTLMKGDRVLVDKEVYEKSDPERGDIVVFRHPRKDEKSFLSRLVALPGETVEIKNGCLFVNGTPLKGSPWSNIYYYNSSESSYGQEGQKVQIPADNYFVLGDNNRVSRDSRYFGFVPKKNLIGKAYKIYYPFGRSGPLK